MKARVYARSTKKRVEPAPLWLLNPPAYTPLGGGTRMYVSIDIATRVLVFVLNVLWTGLLWYLLITKSEGDGSDSVVRFFTNWAWAINLIFYTIDIVSALEPTGVIFFYLTTCLFPILHANNWVVFFLVFIVLHDNPNILLLESSKFPMGLVLVGDRIYHVIPVVVMLIYVIFRRYNITVVFKFWLRTVRKPYTIFFIVWVLFCPFILSGAYVILFDPRKVYGIEWPNYVLDLFGAAITLLFNGFLIYFLKENIRNTTSHMEQKA